MASERGISRNGDVAGCLRRRVLFGTVATWVLWGLSGLAIAQERASLVQEPPPAPPAARQEAQLPATEFTFAIPAMPLPDAIMQFGRVSGVDLVFDAAVTAGRQSPGVAGRMTAEEALRRLLAGTDVTYAFVDQRTATLTRRPGGSSATEMPGVTAEAARPNPNAEIGNLPPPYAGGQVATGGKLGILGNRSVMDTPFNQTNYTSKLIQDQQSRFMSDVVRNDPAVRVDSAPSTGLDNFNIRGFPVSNADVLLNGSAGIAPSMFNSMMAEGIERIEVLKGPSALLNGAVPGGAVGGTINVVPKRAGADPLAALTMDYTSDLQLGGHADVGRRFGAGQEFGVRMNAVYRDGETPVENQSREARLATLGLDYAGDRFRLSSDLGYQYQDLQGTRRFSSVATGVAVPKAPENHRNFFSPSEFSQPEVFYGTLRGEGDIVEDHLTAFVAIGASRRDHQYISSNRTITNLNGTLAAATLNLAADQMDSVSTEAGIRASFDTGPVKHQATFAHTWQDRDWRRSRVNFSVASSNIYNPRYGNRPPLSLVPDVDDTRRLNDTRLRSFVIGDTMSFLDDRVQITAGGRHQTIENENYNFANGAFTDGYKESAITPMAAAVLKPWRNVSFYANYIEGLQQGPVAPNDAANAGVVFPPYVTKQYEAGVKVDFGQLMLTVAGYQVAQPSGVLDPTTKIFGVDGEQRHRGVDVNVLGELTDGLRVLSGFSYISSELLNTAGGVNDGKTGIGVPAFRLVLGMEWDTSFVEGFTIGGRLIYNSSSYLDAANRQRVPDWNQFDLSARYTFDGPLNKPIVIRAAIENVFDANYWIGMGTQLSQNDPRTFKLSTTFQF